MEHKRAEVILTESRDAAEVLPQDADDTQTGDDARLESRVKWKLDLTILPLLTSIQFLSQLVRQDSLNQLIAKLTFDQGQVRPRKR